LIQNASDTGEGTLVFFLFDLLFLDGENLMGLPLAHRKARLASLLTSAPDGLQYNDHQIGQGSAFYQLAFEHGLEGIVPKRVNGRYEPDCSGSVADRATGENSSWVDGFQAVIRPSLVSCPRHSCMSENA
jgi:ATP-dependent DNA ligase